MNRLRDVLTTRGQGFLAAGITLVICGWGLGFPDIARVGILLVVLPLVTALASRRARASIRVERHLVPHRVSVDEPATVTMLLQNTSGRRSPLLLVEERLDYVLGDRPRFLLGRLDDNETRQLDYGIRSHLRGRHTLGPLRVQLRDPFGLTARFAEIGGTDEVVVLPRIEPLPNGTPRGSGLGSEGETPHMIALHGEDDQSIREYRDGDDLRRIHWPATARTGDLMVRQEDRPARRRATIVLDPRAAGHRGTGSGSSFEWAVSAVASMVAYLTDAGYAVHLVSAESVASGQARLATDADTALDLLAEARLSASDDLSEIIRTGNDIAVQGGLVIAVVADHDSETQDGRGGEGLRRVASLRPVGGTGLAMVLDTASYADPRRAPGDRASTYAETLHLSGWAAVPVSGGTSVADAWAALTTAGVMSR